MKKSLIIFFSFFFTIFSLTGCSKETIKVGLDEGEREFENTQNEIEELSTVSTDSGEILENEILITFNDQADNVNKKEIFEEYDLNVLEIDEKNMSYLVYIPDVHSTQGLQAKIEELKSNPFIDFVLENKEALPQEKHPVINTFEFALEEYEGNANTFLLPDREETFLYPVTWSVEDDLVLVDNFNEGNLEIEHISDDAFSLETIPTLLEEDFIIEGDIDKTIRQDGINVHKWFSSNGEIIKPQAILQFDDAAYFFTGNGKILLPEFDLVINSFTLR